MKISVQLKFRKSAREEAKGSLWVLIPVFFTHLGLLFSRPVVSDSVTLGTAARQVSLSLTTSRVCPSSCSLHQWCRPTNSSSVTLFSFCPQSFPASGTFPLSQLFASDDQNTGASASASVFPVNIHSRSPLRLACLISLLPRGIAGVFSSTAIWRHQFFGILPSPNHVWPLGRTDPWLHGPLSTE